jgi:hypothetical protein
LQESNKLAKNQSRRSAWYIAGNFYAKVQAHSIDIVGDETDDAAHQSSGECMNLTAV